MSTKRAARPAPTFYDVQDVADMFQMSRMTVYRAIKGGELPAIRIRGRWFVPARVIDALVTSAEEAVPERPAGAPHWATDSDFFESQYKSREA
jgi:excisionase family DNA binding protein